MMTSFPLDPAYYMAAYKRHQSIATKDKTDKMLSLQTKATEKLAWKSRAVCTGEQHLSGAVNRGEINKTDQTLVREREV